jgi:probable H4MPT-linked C1 transfer pathway protein
MLPSVLGLDIGGANLKAAHSSRQARSQPFELWRNPDGLSNALSMLVREMPAHDILAVTMTGELCDCFETKREGVKSILDAVRQAAAGVPARVWNNRGRFADLDVAQADPLPFAAANWLALATFAGRFAPRGFALHIDIGSTTTDIIPLSSSYPIPWGRTDPERLESAELVYTGVRRTPVCALLNCAAEWFATTYDVYLLLDWIPEDECGHGTADGRPATRACAHGRMARMLGADKETATTEQTTRLSLRACLKQVEMLNSAMERVAQTLPSAPEWIILSGTGEFLARLALEKGQMFPAARVVALSQQLSPGISEAACAYAVAMLAAEECS